MGKRNKAREEGKNLVMVSKDQMDKAPNSSGISKKALEEL